MLDGVLLRKVNCDEGDISVIGCCLDYIIHLFFVHIKPWAWVTELDR